MFYQADDRIFDRNELDVRLIKYNYALPLLREALIIKTIKPKGVQTSFYMIQ
jgi:sulfatase modifying factor 1